jgi:eukaryotic-like serine/threonine-protein kinase
VEEADPSAPNTPDRIGPYRILDTLGEGGMGTVYLAEQKEPVRRRAALKVIKLGMDSKQVVSRFELERQALAVMNHPAIAKVLEAGITEQGQPYFVMELVEGTPLTDYCDQHKLNLKERIDIFQQICRGVQHAHQKGVVHRDLKPCNVPRCRSARRRAGTDHAGLAPWEGSVRGADNQGLQPIAGERLWWRRSPEVGDGPSHAG